MAARLRRRRSPCRRRPATCGSCADELLAAGGSTTARTALEPKAAPPAPPEQLSSNPEPHERFSQMAGLQQAQELTQRQLGSLSAWLASASHG